MENKFVFNREIIKANELAKVNFFIGIDTYDEKRLTYCFVKCVNNVSEILLLKQMKDKENFEEEVSNLQKYFDAIVVMDKRLNKNSSH